MTKHAQQWGKRHLKINAVPTCTAAMHVLSFCRSLQRAFSSLRARKICDSSTVTYYRYLGLPL